MRKIVAVWPNGPLQAARERRKRASARLYSNRHYAKSQAIFAYALGYASGRCMGSLGIEWDAMHLEGIRKGARFYMREGQEAEAAQFARDVTAMDRCHELQRHFDKVAT